MQGRRGVQRVTLAEGARLLGISKGAVRQRVRRGTLRSDKGEDGKVYVYVDADHDVVPATGDPRDALIAELHDRVRSLEDANRENRRLLAAALERIPAIEAPADERESDLTATSGAPDTEDRPRAATPQEPTQPRPWWRRLIGS